MSLSSSEIAVMIALVIALVTLKTPITKVTLITLITLVTLIMVHPEWESKYREAVLEALDPHFTERGLSNMVIDFLASK